MIFSPELSFLFASGLLVVASVLDLKTGKFPNWLFLLSSGCGIFFLIFKSQNFEDVFISIASALLLFVCLTPLVFANALGAGDIKLLTSFCLFTSLSTSISVLLFSLAWGLLMGFIKIAVSGELSTFTNSFFLRTPQVSSQKIPYAVAILLGWMSVQCVGGLL